jgi:tRNA-(ms[2]io[6]A)-hydroxylase
MFCLTAPTDPAWLDEALADLDAVLVDHAHCEMKAASNALSLAARHPANARLVLALTDLAREEIDHFQRVLRELSARGIALGAPPVDDYAQELRRAAATLPERHKWAPLVDRLLVGALIEARSCERFKLLLGGLPPEEAKLAAFYTELFAAEARHYRTFVDLAVEAAGGEGAADVVGARLAQLAALEGDIVRGLAARERRAAMHG